MTQFLIFQDNAEFSAWHTAVNTALGYPNALTRTDTYTAAIPHPDDGREACAVDEQCPAELLAGYTLYAEADLLAQGWKYRAYDNGVVSPPHQQAQRIPA